MDIDKTGPTAGRDLASLYGQKSKSVSEEHSGEKAQQAGTGGTAVRQMLEISPEARERAEGIATLEAVRPAWESVPETRAEIVAQVQERLASGYYETDEVLEQLAGKLSSLVRRLDAVGR